VTHSQIVLSRTCFPGHLPVVRVLLAARANVNAMHPQQRTILMIAATNGHVPMVKALLEAGAQ
jgi:ankyrin repeat protein